MIGRATACLGVAATVCAAQESASWFAELDVSDDSSSVDVTLWLSMESNTPFLAFASAIFDTLIEHGEDVGTIVDWEVLNELDALTGDKTTTDGVSLFGTTAGQILTAHFTESNPIDILRFTWKAAEGYLIADDGVSVSYTTNTDFVILWVGDDFDGATTVKVPMENIAEASFGWHVIPAPGTTCIALTSVAIAFSRRRSRPTH
jgi:hypothetical protein